MGHFTYNLNYRDIMNFFDLYRNIFRIKLIEYRYILYKFYNKFLLSGNE